MIAYAENVLHGVDGRLDARAVARVRDEIDGEARAEARVSQVTDGHVQRGEHLRHAELVRVVRGQQEQNVDMSGAAAAASGCRHLAALNAAARQEDQRQRETSTFHLTTHHLAVSFF